MSYQKICLEGSRLGKLRREFADGSTSGLGQLGQVGRWAST